MKNLAIKAGLFLILYSTSIVGVRNVPLFLRKTSLVRAPRESLIDMPGSFAYSKDIRTLNLESAIIDSLRVPHLLQAEKIQASHSSIDTLDGTMLTYQEAHLHDIWTTKLYIEGCADAGMQIVVDDGVVGYFKTSSDGSQWLLKSCAEEGVLAISTQGSTTTSLLADSDKESYGYGAQVFENGSGDGGNTAFGHQTLSNLLTGKENTVCGVLAGLDMTIGCSNVIMGSNAGLHLTSGNSNILLGAEAGENYFSDESNNIVIGRSGETGESASIRIGDDSHTQTFIAGIAGSTIDNEGAMVLVDGDNRLGTLLSSKRYKENISSLSSVTNVVQHLRPVSFIYKNSIHQNIHYGLIAEEVEEVDKNLVVYNKQGEVETVKYHLLPVVLLKALQEQADKLDQQQSILEKHREILNAQQQELDELKRIVKDLKRSKEK